jgi:Outer membrane protein beta-barrel domain
MKRVTLYLACVLFSAAAVAQTDKGDWLVGGNMTINTAKNNSDFTLQPAAGYFFGKNFAAGAQLTLSFGKVYDTKTTTFGVGPFARYYFNLTDPHFKPLLQADFSILSQKIKESGTTFNNTVTTFFIGGGAAYFINRNVALEGLAGYNNSKYENTPAYGGFSFRLGFQVHLLGSEVKK